MASRACLTPMTRECVAVGLQTPDNYTSSALVETTSAAVGSLDATSTQVQSDGEGDLTATVAAGASPAFGALDVAAGGATPTGSVTFLNDGVPILSCPPWSSTRDRPAVRPAPVPRDR